MSLTRRRFAATCALLPTLSWAQFAPRTPQPGVEYRELRPAQPVETGSKIEVLEFFWYGCPHCATFEPELEVWRRKLAADVEYRRCPVAFDASRTPHTRIYYALEQLKRTGPLHNKVFNAMHVDRKRLLDTNEIADFMAANGIDRKQWLDTYDSFTVATLSRKAAQTWMAYKIDGTPAVGIDGKFVTAPSMAGNHAKALVVMDHLLDRARRERAAGKK